MLSPDQIEEAGERVAAVYREIEARMLDHLARVMAEGWGESPRTVTEAALLAQSQAEELRRMVEEFRPYIDAAVLEVVEECLEASDEDDVARAGGSPEWPAQIDATAKGMAEVLARENIQMAEGAKQAFLNASIEAVTRVNSGDADREAALHRAVRKLERDGIEIITYQDADTGRVTVRNKADVAVRRHVRTQIVQDAQRMTMARMERLGIDLVEVSSHSDSRPSHAEWQGQCYSLKGEQVIDGVRYPDFYLHCMSGDLGDILGGVNCRHSYGPYRHGAPRMYEPDPQHPSGLPGEEVYELEQGQRYRERKIREAKRELRGARMLYDRDKSDANLAEYLKAKQLLRNRQEKMRAYIDGANAKSKTGKPVLHRKPDREWAGRHAEGRRRSQRGIQEEGHGEGGAEGEVPTRQIPSVRPRRAWAHRPRYADSEKGEWALRRGDARLAADRAPLPRKGRRPPDRRRASIEGRLPRGAGAAAVLLHGARERARRVLRPEARRRAGRDRDGARRDALAKR